MMPRRLLMVMTLICLTAVISAHAATHQLKLKDGRVLQGELDRVADGMVWFRVVGQADLTSFAVDLVISIHFAPAGAVSVQKKEAIRVPVGTDVRITLNAEIGSKRNSAGDKFFALLDRDLVVNNVVVVKKGKRVQGRVRKVVRPKRSNDKSIIEIVLINIQVAGQQVPIITDHLGILNDGKGNITPSGAAQIVDATLLQIMDQNHVRIPAGTTLKFHLTQVMNVKL